MLTLIADLGPCLVVLQAGQATPGPGRAPRPGVAQALRDLGAFAERIGVKMALKTGLESGPALAAFLQPFSRASVAVSFDPANLLMHGFDPYDAVVSLRERITHVHVRDCRKGSVNRVGEEMALGLGDVDWLRRLAALHDGGYRGWLTVEREFDKQRTADLASGVTFLRCLVP